MAESVRRSPWRSIIRPAHGENSMATTVETMTTSETADTPRPNRLTSTHRPNEKNSCCRAPSSTLSA